MKAYVILRTCEGAEFETILFDADDVIEYLNKNQNSGYTFEVKTFEVPKSVDDTVYQTTPSISIPAVPYRDLVCKTWNDCTNPFRDCIYCPLRYLNDIFSTTDKNLEQSVLNDTVKVTCTNDTKANNC